MTLYQYCGIIRLRLENQLRRKCMHPVLWPAVFLNPECYRQHVVPGLCISSKHPWCFASWLWLPIISKAECFNMACRVSGPPSRLSPPPTAIPCAFQASALHSCHSSVNEHAAFTPVVLDVSPASYPGCSYTLACLIHIQVNAHHYFLSGIPSNNHVDI